MRFKIFLYLKFIKKKEMVNCYIGTTLFDKYCINEKIGEGSFGNVFNALNLESKERVAIKIEEKQKDSDLLKREYQILKTLKNNNIPKVYMFGNYQNMNAMVMELLGDSLTKCHEKMNKSISFESALILALELFKTIKFIHSLGFIHRDLKPDNIMFGKGKKSNIAYIIDFGLCKKYMDNNIHIPFSSNKKLVGTARFSSINSHKGYELSRRDDLESICYIIIYLIKGSLPWQGLTVEEGENQYTKIFEKKNETRVCDLCSNLPSCIKEILQYVKNLDFDENPDYDFIIRNIENSLKENNQIDLNQDITMLYDWNRKVKKSSKNILIKKSEEEIDIKNALNQIMNSNAMFEMKESDLEKNNSKAKSSGSTFFKSQKSKIINENSSSSNSDKEVESKIKKEIRDEGSKKEKMKSLEEIIAKKETNNAKENACCIVF